MKIIIWVSILLMLVPVVPCVNAQGDFEAISLEGVEDVQDVALNATGQWIATIAEDVVRIHSNDGKIVNTPQLPPSHYHMLSYGLDALYVFSESDMSIIELDRNGRLSDRTIYLPADIEVLIDFSVIGEKFIFHGMSDHDDFYSLGIWIMDGLEVLKLDASGVTAYCTTPGHTLLTYSNSEGDDQFNEYELTEVAPVREFTSPFTDLWAMGCTEDGVFFCVDNGTLFKADSTDGERIPVEFFGSEYSNTLWHIFPQEEAVLIWRAPDNRILRIPQAHRSTQRVLNVTGPMYNSNATIAFERKYDNIKVNFRKEDVFSTEKTMTMLLAQDSSVDIFGLESVRPGAQSIIQKGYFVDLFASDILRNDVELWYPAIREASIYNERLFGYPVDIITRILYIDEDNLSRAGVAFKSDMSWSQFFDLMKGKGDGVTPIYQGSRAAHSNFLTDELVNVLDTSDREGSETLIGEFLINWLPDEPNAYIAPDSLILRELPLMARPFFFFNDEEEIQCLPLPSLTGRGNIPAMINWLIVNPFSENREEAVEYIEEHAIIRKDGDPQQPNMQFDQYSETKYGHIPNSPQYNKKCDELSEYYIMYWRPQDELHEQLNAIAQSYHAGLSSLEDSTLRIFDIMYMAAVE